MEKIRYKLFGALYGFPTCCVEAFCNSYCVETHTQYPDGPWLGTGYIPCVGCAPKAAQNFDKFVGETIAPNRICPAPFPNELSETGTDATLSLVAELEIDALEALEDARPRWTKQAQPVY